MLSGMIRAYQNCVECKGKTTKNNTKKTSPPEIKVVWEKAHTTEYGQKRYVEVPVRASQRVVNLIDIKRDSLSYTPDSTMFKTIFDRLLISRNRGDDKFSSQIIRFHPDRDYLEKYNYDINHLHLHGLNDFTGYLEYFTSEWERISAVRVVDGKPKRRYRLKKSS
ncbi:MAG TPA: hypothetical protein PKA53_04925, partial [Sphingobacterium sp.]|nr:hypothetical protein [Sphingobacterium sp.]